MRLLKNKTISAEQFIAINVNNLEENEKAVNLVKVVFTVNLYYKERMSMI